MFRVPRGNNLTCISHSFVSFLHRSKSVKATDAAAGPLGRHINPRGNPRGSCLALLLAVALRPSSANLLTKMNLGKAGGVAASAGGGGQPFELLLPKDQLDQDDVDVDVNLICDATFKFGIDGFIDDEEGKSVSCCSAVVFDPVICRWVHRIISHHVMCTHHLMVGWWHTHTTHLPFKLMFISPRASNNNITRLQLHRESLTNMKKLKKVKWRKRMLW